MGRPADLSRERIVAAALALLDERGAPGLTMRGLAARLGVQAASLYHHVRGLDDLVDGMQDSVNAGIDLSPLDRDDRPGLEAFARSYRAAYHAHPAAADLVSRRALTAPTALVTYDALAAHLLRRGVADADVMPVMAALDYVVLGAAGESLAEDVRSTPPELVAAHPHLARVTAASDVDAVDDRAFELSLHVVLSAVDDLVSVRAPR